MNLYGYAGGDPLNLADPFGTEPCTAAQLDAGWRNVRGTNGKPECEASSSLPAVVTTADANGENGLKYCAVAKKLGGTVFSGTGARVALMYGLEFAIGVYASPTEYGSYLRGGFLFGLEGSGGLEHGGNLGGLKGFSVGANGSTQAFAAGASIGLWPSLSVSGSGGRGGGTLPLAGSLEFAYTHTKTLGACPQ